MDPVDDEGERIRELAHRLRSPLTSVLGYSELLKGRVDDPMAREFIDMIEQAAGKMRRLVEDALVD